MGTKTYLPTREDQIATNAKIAAVAETTDKTLTKVSDLQAKVNEIEGGFSTARLAKVTLTLNATGSSYEVRRMRRSRPRS